MLLDKSYFILEKMNKIATKLNIQTNIVPVVTISKNGLSNNRIMFNIIDFNATIDKNTIYDNLDYICKELEINIKTNGNVIIREIFFSFDFDRNIYKVYYARLKMINIQDLKLKII